MIHRKTHSDSGGQPGTEEAFMDMVKRNEALIYKVCLAVSISGGDVAEEQKQDILCNLWRGYEGFRKESKESTWIYKIALNTGIQYYHRNERLPLTEELTPQMAERYVGEDDSRQLDRMYELIHRLDDEEQKLVYLYIDKVSGKEMAEVLGISEGNVRIKMFRVKEKLKRMAQYEKD